jgi:hypothetical protein
VTMGVFCVVLTILLDFFVLNFTEIYHERCRLAKMLAIAERKQLLYCLQELDKGEGVPREAFTLAVLQQLGVVSDEDLQPWFRVSGESGVLFDEVFSKQPVQRLLMLQSNARGCQNVHAVI